MPRSGVLEFYSQCKYLFVFQLEHYINAFREGILSALSLFVFLIDTALMRDPQNGSF